MAHLRENFTHTMDHEKEYHFDEGVGVSLEEHLQDLKQRYPEATVQTRRDRDGFAIVKLSYRPEFKYDLDQIMAMNSQERDAHAAETLEAILQVEAGGSTPAERLQQLGPEQIESAMSALRGDESSLTGTAISDKTMLAIRQLAQDRAAGRYRDDLEGFKAALEGLMEGADADAADGASSMATHDTEQDLFGELYNDRERFRSEIALQLRARINHHMRGTKRKAEDFVKPRHNEASLLSNLSRQVGSLEDQVQNTDEAGENFDREAFDQLKRELSSRKKLKEDMLSGTLPRFKPYLRI